MINDREEREHRARFSPVERNVLNMAFLPWLLLEAAELTVGSGFVLLRGHVSLSPSFSPVTVLLQLPRCARTARWKQIHRAAAVLCVTSTGWANKPAQKAERAQSVWDGVGTGEEEQDGCSGGQPHAQVSFWPLRIQHLGPKVMCSSAVWWEVQVELCDPGTVLQKTQEKMQQGPCFTPSATCSNNYFPKTILWGLARWKPTFCGQPCPQCPFLWPK